MVLVVGVLAVSSPATRAHAQQPRNAAPVSAKLSLQSGIQPGANGRNRIPISKSDPAYTVEKLDIFPAIYLEVTFADGSKIGPHDYQKYFPSNVIFDDTTSDPNDIIQVVYWDVDSNNPQLGKYAAQLTSTGKGVGLAYLKVSFRNAPSVTAWVGVEVVSGAQAQPVPQPQQQATGAVSVYPQSIDTNATYRLTNAFLGDVRFLDTFSDGNNDPFMGKTGNYSGQLWKITPAGNGYYRLTNTFLGEGRSLDTYSDKPNTPFMGKSGNFSGQLWKITPIRDGYYRLTNSFLGEGRSLDTYSGTENKPFMGKPEMLPGRCGNSRKCNKPLPLHYRGCSGSAERLTLIRE
jgi:hypothetical protein